MPMPIPLRERLYQTDAVILTRRDLNEADRILTIYTPHRGRYSVIAKGMRRPASRLGPHLELLARARLMLSKGRDLDVVTGAETLKPHLRLRTDLDAYGHACHAVELLLRLTEERQENEAVFDLLTGTLRLLDDGVDPFAVTRHFELGLFTLLGFKPELYRCLGCEEPLEAVPNALSSRLGGMLCPRCRSIDAGAFPLSVNAQKYLRALDRSGLAAVARLTVTPDLRNELEGAFAGYVRHIAERDIQSLKVWHSLRDSLPVPQSSTK